MVFTVKDRCRVCYTCVRECPVKAIRIFNGQAEVIHERCIACGNCVKVCSQEAKVFLDTTQEVREMLNNDNKVIACVAPSFPAEFVDIPDYRTLVGMIRQLGFDRVLEVGFGADMVSKKYNGYFDNSKKPLISSDCPAIVYYIEHYHPDLVASLAPIASPMVATARIARKKYGAGSMTVFIGPCIAKKAESLEIDEVITFRELRKMFLEAGITPEGAEPSEFDPPLASKGAIFPVSRGLLQSVDKTDDVCEGNIVVAEGKENFREAIKEFECGHLKNNHLELLSCEGCIMGPGMTRDGQKFSRRTMISDYVKNKLDTEDKAVWEQNVSEFIGLDFSEKFQPKDRRNILPHKEEIDKVLLAMGKAKPEDHLNCGACGYDTCIEHAIAIINGLAETEMCLPYTIERLHLSIQELNRSNEDLASTRLALSHSEKLASMGQLSAGIAHELNNPLGVITMYSNILLEETREDDPIRDDLKLIVEQTNRCKSIVGGLLNFARKNQVRRTETNMEDFCKKSLESVVNENGVQLGFTSDMKDPYALIDQEQMMQVLTNLEKNALEAMPKGGHLNIRLGDTDGEVIIAISDTGGGISKENMDKIFTPFFTTKGIGKGTGLGLPLVYGIVKMHRGQIHFDSNDDPAAGATGTTFTISLPRT